LFKGIRQDKGTEEILVWVNDEKMSEDVNVRGGKGRDGGDELGGNCEELRLAADQKGKWF
jgi:hypothetical protein